MNFNQYQKAAVSTAFFPQNEALSYLGLGLTGEAGEVAEKIKKIIRDSGGYLTSGDRVAIAKEIGDVMWYVANLCEYIGTDMNYVAEMNVAKLQDRKKRNVLKGSGDNR